jgi:hypothetical protein
MNNCNTYLCTVYLFQAAIQIANGNPERSTSENDTNEMTLVGKIGK